MGQKFKVVSPIGTYQTIKQLAAGSARTKGDPELLQGVLAFAFDTYASGADHLLIFSGAQVEIEAQAVDAELAQVNFALGQPVYWDAAASNVTNVAGSNTPIGRTLEAKNYSAGVPLGSTLLIQFEPDLRTVASPVAGVAAGYKVARGQHTTVAASDTVVTGLATVVSVVAVLEGDPVIGCDRVTAQVGNQSGAPAAGSIIVKTWKPTATGDATPVAATTFGKKVNWVAVGT